MRMPFLAKEMHVHAVIVYRWSSVIVGVRAATVDADKK